MPAALLRFSLLLMFGLFSVSPLVGQVPSEIGDWPQWRGPDANGVSRETGLLKEWPEGGPKVLWKVDSVGVGYSSIAVKGDRIYTLGDLDGVEQVLCLDAKDGSVVWASQPGQLAQLLSTRIEKEFQQLDKNQDGRIDESEGLARFGWDFTKYDRALPEVDVNELASKRVTALIQQIDANGNGQVEFSEGSSLFRDRFERMDTEDKEVDATALAARRAVAYLNDLDANGDKKLSKEEVRRSALERQFGRIDQRDPNTNKGDDLLTAEEIEQALIKHEPGRDGVVTLKEMVSFYVREKVSGDGELSQNELRSAFGGYRNGMGDGPRGTPTIDGERLYIEGGNGDVACMNAATGETIWHLNLTSEFGGRTPGWGYSESPLVVGKMVVVTPGGQQGTIVALDKMTGEKLWQSSSVTEGAHYSTPVLATINGIQQIVQFGNASIFGVSLENGQQLWSYKAPANGTANCCSPIVDDNHVFAASAYGTGGGLVKVNRTGDSQTAEEVYFEKKLQCHHGGIVKIGDFMYTCGDGPLTCVNFKTGKIAWQARCVGKGSVVAADGMLYVLSEGHRVALVEVTPEEYREHGTFEISSHGRPSWAHPVVAGGVLYIRDQESLTAYDI
ncbi:MAG: PQQ-binding-like beta-propeller repeat protein, partial [Planctomycetaceae bacterium]